MKKIFIVLAILSQTIAAMSQTQIDGICYELQINDKKAKVIQANTANYYSGSVIIPNKVRYRGVEYDVESIGSNAFNGCVRLTNVIIPDGVKYIGHHAFADCSMLENIKIPQSVYIIGEGAFEYCDKLKTIVLPNIYTISERTFQNCRSLTSITIPSTVSRVGYLAFARSGKELVITILSGFLNIDANAFHGCSIKKIYVPKGKMKYYLNHSGFPRYCRDDNLFKEINTK